MDVLLCLGKGLLRLLSLIMRLACRMVVAACDASENENQTSIYDPYEAHELYEKGDISLDEFLKATRPR